MKTLEKPHRIAVIGDGLSGKAVRTDFANGVSSISNTELPKIEVVTIAPHLDPDQQPIFDSKDSGDFSELLTLNSCIGDSGFPEILDAQDFLSWAQDNGLDTNSSAFPTRTKIGVWASEQEKLAWEHAEKSKAPVANQRIDAKVEQITELGEMYSLDFSGPQGRRAETFDQVVLAFGHVFSPRFAAISENEKSIIGVPNAQKLESLRPVIENAKIVTIAGGRSSTVDTVTLLEALGYAGEYLIVAPNGPLCNWVNSGRPEIDDKTRARWCIFDLLQRGRANLVVSRLSNDDVSFSPDGKFLANVSGSLIESDLFCDCTGPYDSLLVDHGGPDMQSMRAPLKFYPFSLARSLVEDIGVPMTPKGKLLTDEKGRLNRKNLIAVGPVVHSEDKLLMAQIGERARCAVDAVIGNLKIKN